MFIPDCRRCCLSLNLTNFVFYILKSCTLYPIGLTQLIFSLNLLTCLAHEGNFVNLPNVICFFFTIKNQNFTLSPTICLSHLSLKLYTINLP
ncbi:hypothetical protein Hanom_Chr05g00426361 [Helianthus anomalus]